MNATDQPTILVIIGVTGDLSRRYLLPAIEQLVEAKALSRQLKVIGITRRDVTVDDVLDNLKTGVTPKFLKQNLEMYKMDLTEDADYTRLKKHLNKLARELGGKCQHLFYLSVPPQISQPIVACLGRNGLARRPRTKLLLEKPFGTDLASAEELVTNTRQHFRENQIYRIDHFLAKEMAQNLVVFQEGNTLFKRTWNNQFIERIEIQVSEKIGIEGRAAFYDQTGALRDIVQSHLLQLAALTLMESPGADAIDQVPARRLEALKQLYAPSGQPVRAYAVRGQYKDYRKETGNPKSCTETFVRLTLQSRDPRWEGVPIVLVTGKALSEKVTAIRIAYKKHRDNESNELVIKLQPNEGIELVLWAKVPGYERRVEKHSLKLDFKDFFPILPNAYEQVLLDAINDNHSLFTGSQEVMESWRILQPVQQAWEMSDEDLVFYKPGALAEAISVS